MDLLEAHMNGGEVIWSKRLYRYINIITEKGYMDILILLSKSLYRYINIIVEKVI